MPKQKRDSLPYAGLRAASDQHYKEAAGMFGLKTTVWVGHVVMCRMHASLLYAKIEVHLSAVRPLCTTLMFNLL